MLLPLTGITVRRLQRLTSRPNGVMCTVRWGEAAGTGVGAERASNVGNKACYNDRGTVVWCWVLGLVVCTGELWGAWQEGGGACQLPWSPGWGVPLNPCNLHDL